MALVAETVHFHALLAIHAHQLIVVLALNAVFADDVALVKARQLRRVQFRFADFADIPDDVRGQTIARIKPVLHAHHFEFGKGAGVLVRIDEGQFGRRQFFLDRDGFVLRGAARLKPAHARHQAVVIQIQPFGDRPQVFRLQVFARQIQAERRVIVDDHAAVAIQNLAARREHRNRLDAVFKRAFLIHLRIADLQVPKAGDQKQEDGDGGVLKKGDLLRRELRIVAQKRVRGASSSRPT